MKKTTALVLTLALAGGAFGGGAAAANAINNKNHSVILEEKNGQLQESAQTQEELKKELEDKERLLNDLKVQIEGALSSTTTTNSIDFSSVKAASVLGNTKLENGNYLFTFNGMGGIWLYDVESKTFVNKYDTANSYSTFKVLNNGIFIYSTSADCKGLLYFDLETEEVKLVTDAGYNYYYIYETGDYCLIRSGQVEGLLSFDTKTYSTNVLYDTDKYYTLNTIEGGILVYSSTYGLNLFDNATGEMTNLYSFASTPTFFNYDSYCLIKSGKTFAIYDYSTKEISLERELELDFSASKEIEHGLLFYTTSSNSTLSTGLLYFDSNAKEFNSICDDGVGFKLTEATNGILYYSSAIGIGYYNFETKENLIIDGGAISPSSDFYLTTSGAIFTGSDNIIYTINFSTFEIVNMAQPDSAFTIYAKIDGGYLISSSVEGIYYFNEEANEVTLISEIGKYFNSCVEVEGGYILSCAKYSGTVYYGAYFMDKETLEVSLLYDSGHCWSSKYDVAGGSILFTIATNYKFKGALFYDAETKTAKQITSVGYARDYTITEDGTDIVLECGTQTYVFDTITKDCYLKYDTSYTI